MKPAPILSILEMDILSGYIKNFGNIIIKLYNISHVALQADFIFLELIPCHLIFCINKIKSTLSILYFVKQVFLNKKFL